MRNNGMSVRLVGTLDLRECRAGVVEPQLGHTVLRVSSGQHGRDLDVGPMPPLVEEIRRRKHRLALRRRGVSLRTGIFAKLEQMPMGVSFADLPPGAVLTLTVEDEQ